MPPQLPKPRRKLFLLLPLLPLLVMALAAPAFAAAPKVPILHSTDLFHPHADPDDHYDLACLFAIEEFDIRGIVLDLGGTQAKRSGRPAVEQMMRIAGRRCRSSTRPVGPVHGACRRPAAARGAGFH